MSDPNNCLHNVLVVRDAVTLECATCTGRITNKDFDNHNYQLDLEYKMWVHEPAWTHECNNGVFTRLNWKRNKRCKECGTSRPKGDL